jgi:hypothetical protein
MKKMMLFILLVTLPLLSACSSRNQPRATFESDASCASEEAETIDPATREAVFVYGGAQPPKRLVLSFAGEPFLLPSGYVRLVGVVSGGRPIALIEIGGRGLALGKGENINDYRVVGINDNSVVLERGK